MKDGIRGRGGHGPRHPVRVRRVPGRLGGHEQEHQQVLQDTQQGQCIMYFGFTVDPACL